MSMIGCFGKNNRGAPLFRELNQLDGRYVDLGTIHVPRRAHLAALVASVSPNLAQMKREARFAPPFLDETTLSCAALVAAKNVSEVLYWGATNLPVTQGSGIPFSIVTDGPFDPDDPSYPVEWRPQRWKTSYLTRQREVFQRAKHVFTLSEWARQKVISVHGLPPDQVTKCGWGPLACLFPPRLEPSSGTRLIVSVGSDWRRKGMDTVAEAGAALHANNPTVHTIIAGVPGNISLPERPGVSLLATHTPAPVVHSLMRAATCLVVAARFDASPHVIYEALQYGTPVVGTNVCGIPEGVDEPFGGKIASRTDASALVHTIEQLLAEDETTLRRSAFQSFVRSGGWGRAAQIVVGKLG